MNTDEPEITAERSPDPWLALVLLVVTVVAWLGFQTVQLSKERGDLQAVRAAQEPMMQQAQKIRAQLDSIARKTLDLAQQGNPGAALIVEELARRGVTISQGPPTTPAGPAPAPSK